MKKILLFSALSMLALVACTSDDPNDENPSSSSSEGVATLPSSSSLGSTPLSSSMVELIGYCYNADGAEDCEPIGGEGSCWESESECVSETGTVRTKAWCETNEKSFWTCGDIGSCVFAGASCAENTPQDFCEEYNGVFDSSNECDTSIFPACVTEEEACIDINSSFTKDECFEINGALVTQAYCSAEPEPLPQSGYSYCYDYDGDGECARLIGGCWAGSTENSCVSKGGTVVTKEWCENNVSIINHCYTPEELE